MNNHLIYFNSIKVRLELSETYTIGKLYIEFQFHKGTIRTVSCFQKSS